MSQVNYKIELHNIQGERILLLAEPSVMPDTISWSRNVNSMGEMTMAFPLDHYIKDLLNDRFLHNPIFLYREVLDLNGDVLVKNAVEWHGIVVGAYLEYTPQYRQFCA